MTIKFKKSEALNDAKTKLTNALSNTESTDQEQTEAFQN